MAADYQSLCCRPAGVETRWATPENPRGRRGAGGRLFGGRKGFASFHLGPGKTLVLAEESNVSGVVRRIWMTLSDFTPEMLRSLRIDMYWDGARNPAVSAPFGDFFGIGMGYAVPFESVFFSSPEGRSFNCTIPMPFRTGMRIEITNESREYLYMLFYEVDYTVGDRIADDTLYFHAWYHAQDPTRIREDFEILPLVEGGGRYLGANVGVRVNTETYFTSWWGEGEVKIYLDGDSQFPSLCATGTEDYIGTGWELGTYGHLYQGCHVADRENAAYCFYRYHVPDPVFFSRSIRAAVQQIGSWRPENKRLFRDARTEISRAGPHRADGRVDFSGESTAPDYGLFERSDSCCACAYFYLDRNENGLPALEPAAARVACIPESRRKVGSKMIPEEVRLLKQHIPDIESLDRIQLRRLRSALDTVIASMETQTRVEAEMGIDAEEARPDVQRSDRKPPGRQ